MLVDVYHIYVQTKCCCRRDDNDEECFKYNKVFNFISGNVLTEDESRKFGEIIFSLGNEEKNNNKKENIIKENKKDALNEKEYIPLLMTDLTFSNLEIIEALAPYGEGMRSPMFILPRIRTTALTFNKNGEHIVSQIGTNVRLIGWNFKKEKVLEKENKEFEAEFELIKKYEGRI